MDRRARIGGVQIKGVLLHGRCTTSTVAAAADDDEYLTHKAGSSLTAFVQRAPDL